jgi:hypothetical protein
MVPCPNCEHPIKSPVKGSKGRDPECPSCGTHLFNCRRCGTLLSSYLQQQAVEYEDPKYEEKVSRARGDVAASVRYSGYAPPMDYPHLYRTEERWIPCPNCGEPDPSGLVTKYGDTFGLQKAQGGPVITKVYPRRSKAERERNPDPPMPVLRADGLYMAPTGSGFDCIRFYHDDRVAAVAVQSKGPKEQVAREVATWLRHGRKEKGSLSGRRNGSSKSSVSFSVGDYGDGGFRIYSGDIESSDYIQLDCRMLGSPDDRSVYTFVPVAFKH